MDIYHMPHKLNLKTQRGISGGLRGHKSKSLGRLSNGWTDWHQICYTSADSSGNGHRLNTIRPTTPQDHFGFFRGSQIQMFGEAVKRLDRLAPHLVQICGFFWEWTLAKYNSPLNSPVGSRGGGGHKFKSLRIRLGMDKG